MVGGVGDAGAPGVVAEAVADDEAVIGGGDAGGGAGEEVVLEVRGEVLEDVEESDVALMRGGVPGGEVAGLEVDVGPVAGGDGAGGDDFLIIDIEPVDGAEVVLGFEVKGEQASAASEIDEGLILSVREGASDGGVEGVGADFPVDVGTQEAARVEARQGVGLMADAVRRRGNADER